MKKIKRVLFVIMAVVLAIPAAAFADASAPARTQVQALNSEFVNVQFSNGYTGFCIDEKMKPSDSTPGKNQYYAMDATFASKNNNGVPTDEDISQPLKILFTQEFDSIFSSETSEDAVTKYYIDDLYADSTLQGAIWNISDNRYIWGASKALVDSVMAYSGEKIPDHGYQVTTKNGDVVTFHFMVMRPVDPELGIQDFFSYKIDVNASAGDDAEWENSETDHWKECECGVRFDVARHAGGEATCVKKPVCESCGQEYGTADPEKHIWDEGVTTAPTCTEDGYTIYTCKEDKDHRRKIVDQGSATGHVELTKTPAAAAKCEEDGNTEYYTCVCGKLFADEKAENETTIEKTVVPEHGHDYKGAVTKLPTCIADGEMTYTCTYDSTHTYTEPIPATGEHTGGNATETERAVCDVCMQPYGELAPADEEDPDEEEVIPPVEEGSGEAEKQPPVEGGSGEGEAEVQPPVEGGSGEGEAEVQPPVEESSGESKEETQTLTSGQESKTDDSPQTSDDFSMGSWLAAALISLAVCAALLVFRRKKSNA